MPESALRQGAIDVSVSRHSGSGLPLFRTLFQDPQFVWVALIYGVAISTLTLALPISVQVLIGAVANTAVVRSVVVLSIVLFLLLALSGLLVGMQTYVLEIFQRRFYGRMTREIALRVIYADTSHFERINREQLINYYFEIDDIQKNLPTLLSNGLALLLQTIVGYVVVSFYHPIFLFFSVTHAGLVYIIWRQADRRAISSVIQLSKAKHEMANWLESLARHHRLFKSRRGAAYAVGRTDDFTERYIEKHKTHFKYTFSQHVGFLALYAVGSAVVLGISGWLVIQGQLSLGQLVAAELILGAIFVGLSRFGYYLEMYYAICASVDKLSWFFNLPLERPEGNDKVEAWEPSVVFDHVTADLRGEAYQLDAEFPAGSHTFVAPGNAGVVMIFRDLITGMRQSATGRVALGGHDVEDLDAQLFRDHIQVVAEGQIFRSTIAGFIEIGCPGISRAQIRELMKVAGLKRAIDQLSDGLDTEILDSGLPLSPSEALRLRIAQALAARPRILVFTPAWDVLRPGRRRAILEYVRSMQGTTLIAFSNRRDVADFDRFVALENGRTQVFARIEELVAREQAAESVRDRPGARTGAAV